MSDHDFNFKLKIPSLVSCSISDEDGVELYYFACPDDTDFGKRGDEMCMRCNAIAAEVVRRWNNFKES